jgi:hypothetical protein
VLVEEQVQERIDCLRPIPQRDGIAAAKRSDVADLRIEPLAGCAARRECAAEAA